MSHGAALGFAERRNWPSLCLTRTCNRKRAVVERTEAADTNGMIFETNPLVKRSL